ncbi:sensor histidine kinase [Halanaeroarchaeum sulfurireducens]|uniref:sensor histidine kinase n=1 Tax=Halanaeroarchaeum sulfurireducens TaxID=1604004 RepID=UPI0006798800|nr:PAS domain-containing sensor histidine kinase [Halanaeroarchaeum sulfurireducens]
MSHDRWTDGGIYENRLEAAMLAGNVAWWEMRLPDGSVDFHDRKAEVLGYDPADFDHYEDFTELIHTEDYDRAMASMRDHLDGKADRYDVEYRIEAADGSYHWFHDVGSITDRGEEGAPRIVSGIVIDITQRKEYAAEVERHNEQLTLLNRIVRHDIRNDMTLALGLLETIEEDVPDEIRREFEQVRTAAEHVVTTTEDIQSVISVLGGEEGSLDDATVSLQTIVSREVDSARSRHGDAEIAVDSIPDVAVRGNELLSSVIANLVENAIEHSDRETPHVWIDTSVDEETVSLTVADDGPGVPDAIKEELFESGVTTDESGLGLGLYIVATLVDTFDGDVTVEDNDPRGARFSVELRRA